ncbi:uncharacterized protein LOC110866520 [Helianthus annuus]|uniref:uncharacterized protein LOC110866520 n=1 Tax=Helianthus annuus TaxID=4232 RepID=UPI000B903B43|nr:uncharacterized protein LOC110866520 [Helianthus annuus]
MMKLEQKIENLKTMLKSVDSPTLGSKQDEGKQLTEEEVLEKEAEYLKDTISKMGLNEDNSSKLQNLFKKVLNKPASPNTAKDKTEVERQELTKVEAASCFLSDHSPIILSTVSCNFGARPFRIFDSWIGKPGFEEVVTEALNGADVPIGPPDVLLMRKLGNMIVKVKAWRDEMLKNSSEEVSAALVDLEAMEAAMEVRDLTEEDEWILSQSKKILKEDEERKNRDFKQRSRLRWVKDGDENSKFIHLMINSRKANNVIHGLNIDGVWVSKPSLVKKEVFGFFKKKFVEDCDIRPHLTCHYIKKITSTEALELEARFSSLEIKKIDFCNILSEFYDSGKINVGCGSSFIALIPKVKDPLGLKDYHPISLVGIVNKVISKLLANRLKKVLDSIISPSQSAFISGRYILDGPLVVNEVLRWSKKAKKKGIISSAWASVLVNGAPTFEFKCQKGMRQGDLISPFLFVIVMEALSCMINKVCGLGIVRSVDLPEDGPSVSHLFYADDAIIIGDWSRDNIKNFIRILKCFHLCLGLYINFGKSNLFGVGMSFEDIEGMAAVVGCKAESFPCKYLGLTVGANMNRINNWRPVYDIFEKRLSLWKASCLSIGGRVTLIRSVLESLPTYYFSLYRAHVKVVEDLESLIRRFLWGGSSMDKKLHWVAWDRVASPKKMGDLGLHRLNDVNTALLSKRGWRFKTEKDNLWVRVIKAIHSGGSDWDFLPTKKALGGVWHSIVSVLKKPIVGDVYLRNKDFSDWYVMEWCNWVPLKCNIFAWRADMDRIPTVEALARRGVSIEDGGCSFCNDGPDSVSHIFTACPLALGLWEKISFWCRVRNFFVFSFRDLLDIPLLGGRRKSEKVALHGIIITACWLLWKARNNLRFNGKMCNVEDIFSEVRALSYLWFEHRAKNGLLV